MTEQVKQMIPVEPFNDRIVVFPIGVADVTPGGIHLPDIAKERPFRGVVVAVGPGRMLESGLRASMLVKVGDVIFYAKYAGAGLSVGDVDYQTMTENEAYMIDRSLEALADAEKVRKATEEAYKSSVGLVV